MRLPVSFPSIAETMLLLWSSNWLYWIETARHFGGAICSNDAITWTIWSARACEFTTFLKLNDTCNLSTLIQFVSKWFFLENLENDRCVSTGSPWQTGLYGFKLHGVWTPIYWGLCGANNWRLSCGLSFHYIQLYGPLQNFWVFLELGTEGEGGFGTLRDVQSHAIPWPPS